MDTFDLKLKYAAAIALLCKCSGNIDGDSDSKEYILHNIEIAVGDWCDFTGWRYERILDQIEIVPVPPVEGPP